MREESFAGDLVCPVELQLAVLDEVSDEGGHVAGVHLAGMIGNCAGDIDLAGDRDAVIDVGLAGTGQLAVSTALGSQIDDHGPWSHRVDHLASDECRGFLAGDDGRGDDDVLLGYDAAQQFTLPHIEGVVLRGGITTRVFGVHGCDRQLDEACHPGSVPVLWRLAAGRRRKRRLPACALSRWLEARRHQPR